MDEFSSPTKAISRVTPLTASYAMMGTRKQLNEHQVGKRLGKKLCCCFVTLAEHDGLTGNDA
jgi:hypothetical protein